MIRMMFDSFRVRCAEVAVPRGVMALDECGQASSAHTRAKSYNPMKPDPWAIRFYSLNGHHPNYIFSIFDTGSGNGESASMSQRYLREFRHLSMSFNKMFMYDPKKPYDDPPVRKELTGALYALMVTHLYSADEDEFQVRRLFLDSYYTKHNLGRAILMTTEHRVRIVGTVKFNNIEPCNKVAIRAAVGMLEDAPKGSWCLVPAYDPVEVFQKNEKKRKKRLNSTLVFKRVGITSETVVTKITIGTTRQTKETIDCLVSPHSGYVLFKDNKTVIFYTNDLAGDVPIGVWLFRPTDQPSKRIINLVRGLSFVRRWTEEKTVRRSKIDCCVHNAFGVHNELLRMKTTNKLVTRHLEHVKFQEFKRVICSQLVDELRRERQVGKRTSLEAGVPMNSDIRHTLWPTAHSERSNRNMRLQCFLCQLAGDPNDTRSTVLCRECNKGFHIECFNAWHNPRCVKEQCPAVYQRVQALRDIFFDQKNNGKPSAINKKSCADLNDDSFKFMKYKRKDEEESKNQE